MKIRAIFVDLGGVLLLNKAQEVYKDFECRYGLKSEVIKDVFTFLHSAEKTKEELAGYLALNKIDPAIWAEFTQKFYSSEKRNDKLVEILQKAKDRGIKIIYTSNNSSGLDRVLRKYALSNLPDIVINSSLENVSKPDSKFWEKAFIAAGREVPGITKVEILAIDDSETNYKSAIKFGLSAIKYLENINKKIEVLLGC